MWSLLVWLNRFVGDVSDVRGWISILKKYSSICYAQVCWLVVELILDPFGYGFWRLVVPFGSSFSEV